MVHSSDICLEGFVGMMAGLTPTVIYFQFSVFVHVNAIMLKYRIRY